MATALNEAVTRCETLADLLDQLGDIPPGRVLLHPWPGTATEEDLLRLPKDIQRLCELVNGTLVVKAMGTPGSVMAFALAGFLGPYLKSSRIGIAIGPEGHTRYFGNQVRMPDVAVILRSRLPDGKLPKEQICPIPPEFAVEILSPGNTKQEIDQKLQLFFDSQVKLVWIVDPRRRTVRVHTSPDDFTEHSEGDALDGGDVLPGFTVSIQEWFNESE